MSENLDLVRSIYSAHERGDWSSVDWADPEIEFVFADGPNPGRWIGVGAMGEAWRDYLRAWEDYRVEVEEYRELDCERVLVLIHQQGRGQISGLELGQMQTKNAALFHVRDGKVTRFVVYWTATTPSPTSAWRGRRCPRSPRRLTWRTRSGEPLRLSIAATGMQASRRTRRMQFGTTRRSAGKSSRVARRYAASLRIGAARTRTTSRLSRRFATSATA
jgi:ketosteroid isomerase-like protein